MQNLNVKILPDEVWWGCSSALAMHQPYDKDSDVTVDLCRCSNQSAPLLLSSDGRYIWGGSPFTVTFDKGSFTVVGEDIELVSAGSCLRDAYMAAMRAHFPFEQKDLPETFFTTAQYNTWMEFNYHPTQASVLEYAHAIIDNGYKPGILILDEGWSSHYGSWNFDLVKFPNPKAMIDELHSLGFTVMLWIVPYVTLDDRDYLELSQPWVSRLSGKEYSTKLARRPNGDVAVVCWWNGLSGLYNMCNEADREWLDSKLQHLIDEYGVDGFKFDGGNICSLNPKEWVTEPPAESAEALNKAWNDFGTRYAYHEYKDTYDRGGRATIQRIRDRNHSWGNNGLQTLVPTALLQGLLGYPYVCPDMVGGGLIEDEQMGTEYTVELYCRYAQASTFLPSFQLSKFFWKNSPVLTDAVHTMVQRHYALAPYIQSLLENTAKTGEPIVRSIAYEFNERPDVIDEFMLGDKYLVAPVLIEGARSRTVYLPSGKWKYIPTGEILEGAREMEFAADLTVLPYFEKIV